MYNGLRDLERVKSTVGRPGQKSRPYVVARKLITEIRLLLFLNPVVPCPSINDPEAQNIFSGNHHVTLPQGELPTCAVNSGVQPMSNLIAPHGGSSMLLEQFRCYLCIPKL